MSIALVLSGLGVTIAAIAFYNRDNPAWQKDMRTIYALALLQVALGVMAYVVAH